MTIDGNSFALGVFAGLIVWGLLGVSVFVAARNDRLRELRERDQNAYDDYLHESGFDPDECAACHMSGDCPLCGSNDNGIDHLGGVS